MRSDSTLKTLCELKVYEIDHKDAPYETPPLRMRSHWNLGRLVEIEVDGKWLAVDASDLEAAARRCSKP